MKMKKTQSLKFLALSLIIGVAGFFANAWANDNVTLNNSTIFDDGGLKFKVTDFNKSTMQAKVEVSGNSLERDVEEIEIPESFTRTVEGKWNGSPVKGTVTFTVTAIGQDAFMDLPKVKEIVIPGTVETIADDAFDNCGYMATVTFGPNSQITTLGDAIWGVSNIKEIDFSNCHKLDLSTGTPFIPRNGEVNNQLTKVTLPAEIESIGEAFANCPKLATLDLSGTKVTTLDDGALYGDAGLTSITFPAVQGKTLSIGDEAMCGTNITEITINTNLTTGSLTKSSFAGIALQKVTVNGELLGAASIPEGVFAEKCKNKYSKESLQSLVFNGDILAENAIATGAVTGLTKLSKLEFGNISKNGIAPAAFTNNGSAHANIIFHGVLGENSIGAGAFQGSYIAGVTFEQDINTAAIGVQAFQNTKATYKVPVTFKGRLTAENAIGEGAFQGSQLGELIFEKEIVAENAIAKDAFKNANARLSKIDFQGVITKTNAIAETAFAGAGNSAVLTVEDITAPQAINSTAFQGASILSATYNNVNATEAIAPGQFANITKLNTLLVKSDLTYENTIGANAFANTGLTGITFEGDITVGNAICASSESESPFAGAGAGKSTTLDLQANKIVEGGIGPFAFANADINTITLNNNATDLATDAFAANSFKGIATLCKIYYSPAAANVKDHNFDLTAFWPEETDVDILFYTNDAVKYSYENTEVYDATPWRIKLMLGIAVDLSEGIDGNYYGVWAPQTEKYIIDKYQGDAEVTVYSAYFDDKSLDLSNLGVKGFNCLYMNPLRVQDNGKYVINEGEAVLIKSTKDFELVARQNLNDKLEEIYQFGGIQTFAGLNVRQCNDLRYTPWQIYKAAVENNLEDIYGNVVSDYTIFRMASPAQLPIFAKANAIPAEYLYVLATNNLDKREAYSGGWDESWIAQFIAALVANGLLTETIDELNGELATKDALIESLNGQIADLQEELAEASGEEEIARLNGVIADLQTTIDNMQASSDEDIQLMVNLIIARHKLQAAKAAVKAQAEKEYTAADVADNEFVAAAQQALDAANEALTAAKTEMNKFTLGSIYLKMDAALPIVLAKAQPQKDYDAAKAAWEEAHEAYIKLVNTETEDVTETETTVFTPVEVVSNVDAEGEEITGFVGMTYYVKATVDEFNSDDDEPLELFIKNDDSFVGTGIFVKNITPYEEPAGDYSFESYGKKTNYDLYNEMGEAEEGETPAAPVLIQETGKVSNIIVPLFGGSDGNKYYWYKNENSSNPAIAAGVYAVYNENGDANVDVADPEITMTASMVPMTITIDNTEYTVWQGTKDETTSEITPTILKDDEGNYYTYVAADASADPAVEEAAELIEEGPSDENTPIWAYGTVDAADKVTLGGKEYYPVEVLTNNDADGNEIEGYVGETFYVAADDVTEGEAATDVQLLRKFDDNTYPNPVEYTGIYVNLTPIEALDADYNFESFGQKWWTWQQDGAADEDVAFATGTIKVVTREVEDEETGETTTEPATEEVSVENVLETNITGYSPDGETPDGECDVCEAADALKEAAAALCEAAKNLKSEDEDDPCADLKKEMDDAYNDYQEKLQQYGTYNIWPYQQATVNAQTAWSRAYAQQQTEINTNGTSNITDEEIAALWAVYEQKNAELLAYTGEKDAAKEALDAAKDLYDDLLAAYKECTDPSISEYTELTEEELLSAMQELEIAIVNHLSWTDSEDHTYNPDGTEETVEKEALENYLHAKYGEDCTPYDEDNATPILERVAIVPGLEETLAAAQAEAIEALDAQEEAAALSDLNDAIAEHKAAQDAIEADENVAAGVAEAEGVAAGRQITVIWNDNVNVDNDVVGIMEAVVAKSGRTAEGNGAIYNLQGVRVNGAAQKGIYIQNGKKVIVK